MSENACRYLENVPAIVPLLEKEYRNAAARLEATQEELNDLHPDKYAPPAPLAMLCSLHAVLTACCATAPRCHNQYILPAATAEAPVLSFRTCSHCESDVE